MAAESLPFELMPENPDVEAGRQHSVRATEEFDMEIPCCTRYSDLMPKFNRNNQMGSVS